MKLHLGCGHINLPGFVHIDIDDHPHLDYQRDASDLSIFEDNSIELIYASHILDYFDRNQVAPALVEWRRVLIPGGMLRLSVRDFSQLSAIYQRYNDLEKILGYFYTMDEVDGKRIDTKNVFDFKYLNKLLVDAGFINIRKWDWRKDNLPKIPDGSQAMFFATPEKGIPLSLNFECQKPK